MNVLKPVTVCVLLLCLGSRSSPAQETAAELPPPAISYRLVGEDDQWPEGIRDRIVSAMDEAVGLYNRYASIPKEIRVTYKPDLPTADGNINGSIRFGKTIGTRAALHEIAHTVGIGTHWKWQTLRAENVWTGERARARLKAFDGQEAVLHSDRIHFWPYGLNYDREDSKEARIRHVQMVVAFLQDMGLPAEHRLQAADAPK